MQLEEPTRNVNLVKIVGVHSSSELQHNGAAWPSTQHASPTVMTPQFYDHILVAARYALIWATIGVTIVALFYKYILGIELRPEWGLAWSFISALFGAIYAVVTGRDSPLSRD
jgi:hypothetical protein